MFSGYISIQIHENALYYKKSFCDNLVTHEEIINMYKKLNMNGGGGLDRAKKY